MDDTKYKKLLAVEVRAARKGAFFKGILVGVLLMLSTFSGLAWYLWSHRMQYAATASQYVASDFLWNVFRYFPDGYVTNNREKFVDTLDRFTNAASFGKITKDDFQALSAKVMEGIGDHKLTYQEIDDILLLMSQAAGGENNEAH
ncbi:MAG: hypothetical protein AAB354_01985 [candidate division KSB1 bacterium]